MDSDLELPNGTGLDWAVESWDGWTLTLIADNDLTYHHIVEVRFSYTRYVAVPPEFDSVVFRDATPSNVEGHVRLHDPGEDLTLFVWEADSGSGPLTCYVLAESVTTTRALLIHSRPAVG
jgi:hypothetical protein